MIKLFVYDASEVNRDGYRWNNYEWGKWPVEKGFREALKKLNPPIPFLVRTLFGDYSEEEIKHPEYKTYIIKKIIKPTFSRRNLRDLLNAVMENGSDRNNKTKRGGWTWRKWGYFPKDIRSNSVIWAKKYSSIEEAHPYRFDDDTGLSPQGYINDFSMVFNKRLYMQTEKKGGPIFYQPSIELRRKALLGIIISDTNPDKPKLKPMSFRLTPKNLEEVVEEIRGVGYFADPVLFPSKKDTEIVLNARKKQ